MNEWHQLRTRLSAAGVVGAEDLGHFVSNPEVLGSSRFDERAAMPVLIEALPTLTDASLVEAVAGHLRRPWARPVAFPALLSAFEVWAVETGTAGWKLGDALGTAATAAHVGTLLRIAQDRRYGETRQMVVAALERFKKVPEVGPALVSLIEDPEVALHAMGALRRVLGARGALPHLERLERAHAGSHLGWQATRQAKRARKSLA